MVFEEETLENLWRFGRYAVIHYVPAFLLSSCGRDAAVYDLQLYKALLRYQAVDKELANSALTTLNRHLWYLAPHTVMFALFSDKLSEDAKGRMAAKLLTLDRPDSPSLGLPKFPVVTATTELWDLVSEASWEFFDIVKSDPLPWLTKSVSEWEAHPDYQAVKAFVSTVKVVNDSCERAIALAKDYYSILTTDSRVRRMICQVVEEDRKQFPGISKASLNRN